MQETDGRYLNSGGVHLCFLSELSVGKKEIGFGVLLMVVSVTVFTLTFRFPKQTIAFSPTVFPRFVSTCLFILATILLIQGVLGMKKNSGTSTNTHPVDKKFLLRLGSLILLAFAYTRILPLTGYMVATPPFIAGTMVLFNEKRWIWIGTVSLMTSIILYVLFRMIFKVPLPRFNLW